MVGDDIVSDVGGAQACGIRGLQVRTGKYRLTLQHYYWCTCYADQGVDPMCFLGSGPTHFFRSWVRIGIGPTHFLRWIVYYCVCIQHDIDISQISFTELCKTLRTNSGLRAINSCLHLFWPQLCKACWVNIVLWQQNLKFLFHQQTVEFGPTHIFTRIYAPYHRCNFVCNDGDLSPPLLRLLRLDRRATLTPNPGDATGHHHFLGKVAPVPLMLTVSCSKHKALLWCPVGCILKVTH